MDRRERETQTKTGRERERGREGEWERGTEKKNDARMGVKPTAAKDR